jgi:halocyanin-like protein
VEQTNRRKFIGGAGSALLSTVVAGCLGGSTDSGGGSDQTTTTTETTTTSGSGTTTESGGSSGLPKKVQSWMSGAAGFGGSVSDETGAKSVTMKVGAQSEKGPYAFDPAVVRVSPGTEVTWQWTGKGGAHNVVAKGGAFESGDAVSKASATYSHTFEETGTFLYYCTPHRSLGMKGVVIVEK